MLVVDLWGANHDTRASSSSSSFVPRHNYGADGLQNLFSSSKVLTSLVVAMLVDRGHLRYDQRVVDLWPSFAAVIGSVRRLLRSLIAQLNGF